MASTYSTSLKLELMATGDQSGTWGDTTNTNLGTLLEQAITGVLSVAQGDVANLTLTSLDGASDQARNAVVNLTGAMTANRNVVVPTANKVYLIKNSTTGGFVITVKTAAGTGVTIPNGTARWVYCDGTNVVDAISGPWTPSSNDAQALGASGTAWADLFLASGAVINWNAGDVTITHSANTLAFAGASSGYTFDAAVTPSANDAAALGSATVSWADLFGASGFVLNIANGDWVATHTAGILTVGTGDLRVTTAGTNAASAVTVGGTQTLTNKTMTSPVLNTPTVGTSILPTSNDGAALGAAATSWADLFLASGALINWANGDTVLTHSAGVLTVSTGDLRVTTAGTNSASAVTVGGTQTLTNKTMTSPVLNTPTVGTSILPTSNDGAALGAAATSFSDLFLASGGVINWNNGDVTITHSAGTLASTASTFTYTYVDSGAGIGPAILYDRNSSSPAASDFLAAFYFRGRDSGGNATDYVRFLPQILDPTNGSEDGLITIETMVAGTAANRLWLAGGLSMVSAATDPGIGLVFANGYAFPATQVASSNANTLDDYEEGTWTPTLTFSTPGNLSVAYSSQVGTYVKIGKYVLCQFSIVTSTFTHTTAANGLQINGVPFTSQNTSGARWAGSIEFQGITKAGYAQYIPRLAENTTSIVVSASNSGSALGDVTAADMPTGGTVLLRGFVDFIAAA